jgi:hypothetical protein
MVLVWLDTHVEVVYVAMGSSLASLWLLLAFIMEKVLLDLLLHRYYLSQCFLLRMHMCNLSSCGRVVRSQLCVVKRH